MSHVSFLLSFRLLYQKKNLFVHVVINIFVTPSLALVIRLKHIYNF
jgi:hypothetical protein